MTERSATPHGPPQARDPEALPLYKQISELLLRRIASGVLIEGERLAPERMLAAELRVSVGTLRKALADLQERGLLERRQGSGNYIRGVRAQGGLYGFFRLELSQGGGRPEARLISLDHLPKPAGAPPFGPSSHASRVRRLRLLDAVPAALEEIWLDDSRGRLKADPMLEGALYQLYRSHLGIGIARIEDRIGVAPCPDWTPCTGGLGAGAPCGLVERIGWDQAGARAEYSRTWFDHGKVRYVSHIG
ncbi:GntR family transcriptional regulator [Profundibacterium mesophilum]|uniref:Transcriptional regulator GntR family protein n=1 Tax=Profundibacterium mesophilum KAUST100406-0324 TaxID=1037889 RepID=A0A921NQ82_9RHOB|nr:GntR family transcriptional regulator [Profundibacterium mesophilum]KAF0675122.1 Transcriptional regulator GntR family protein [Profundibacterium mesophilum KAUST100406-0324]